MIPIEPSYDSVFMCSINMGTNCYYYCYALPGFWEIYVDTCFNFHIPVSLYSRDTFDQRKWDIFRVSFKSRRD